MEKVYPITGHVIDSTSEKGIPKLRIEAWDKDLEIDDLLGSARTDEHGRFTLSFDDKYYQEICVDRKPDVYFKVFYQSILGKFIARFQGLLRSQNQGTLIKSTEDSVLWNVATGKVTISIPVSMEKDKRKQSFFPSSLISVICAVLIGIIALGITILFHITYDFPDNEVLKLKYMEYFIGIYKTIFVSFLVTLLVALLPQVYSEKKDRFEQLKESRRAYSEAKTAVIYLPYKLSEMDYLSSASALEAAHVKLHMALTYPELEIHLSRLGHTETPEEWGEKVYDKLVAMKEIIKDKSKEWDEMKRSARLEAFKTLL